MAAFLAGKLKFTGIAAVIEVVLEKMPSRALNSIEDVLDADSRSPPLGAPRNRKKEKLTLMNSLLTSIVAVAIVLGVVVLVHEWGHFMAAKIFGVRVVVFSIGYGTRLLGWKSGDTDYRVSVLPLGGYVRLAGDNPVEDRTGAPDEFLSRPRWQRVLIYCAGPFMNFVLAFVVATGIYLVPRHARARLHERAREGRCRRRATPGGIGRPESRRPHRQDRHDRESHLGAGLHVTWQAHRRCAPIPLEVDRAGQQVSLTTKMGDDRKRRCSRRRSADGSR